MGPLANPRFRIALVGCVGLVVATCGLWIFAPWVALTACGSAICALAAWELR